ncbi:MAG TPA: aminoacyl-tRNA hydrolase, partial [Micromonosporaceae bacterium]|nr:aminoacyl-tRNA hydrolase [Micromonosporaceae bacterium]
TRDYLRVRFGIGRPPGRKDPADYVLEDFSPAERKELLLYLERAADAVQTLTAEGLEPTQNEYHPL